MSVTRNRFPGLSQDDRILWSKVASTVRPRPGKTVERIPLPESPAEPQSDNQTPRPALKNGAEEKRKPPPHPQHGIDRVTRRKIAKGRLPIDARIDLHGLAQTEAHAMLFSFLHRAQSEGCKLVLVITGKGSSLGSDGILRRAVPVWLQTPSFRAAVSGFEEAARGHGGEGALYLRIRQKGQGR
jgi:DNA-nicking Smr family endonuclease